MFTLNEAICGAKNYLERWGGDCFVLIEYDEPKIFCGNVCGRYDYVCFSSIDQLQRYISGKVAFDVFDSTVYLRDDERPVKVWSKSKLIFL